MIALHRLSLHDGHPPVFPESILRQHLLLALCLLPCCAAPAAPSCFTPAEVEAADIRVLQQQLNVAALNCQTGDSADPSFAVRYNSFIKQFAKPLQDNAENLRRHFGADKNGLDRWMTRVANQAGQAVITQPDYCQIAWDRLDAMVPLSTEAMEDFAVRSHVAGDLAPACPEKPKKKTPAK
jgi:hypothetical protein